MDYPTQVWDGNPAHDPVPYLPPSSDDEFYPMPPLPPLPSLPQFTWSYNPASAEDVEIECEAFDSTVTEHASSLNPASAEDVDVEIEFDCGIPGTGRNYEKIAADILRYKRLDTIQPNVDQLCYMFQWESEQGRFQVHTRCSFWLCSHYSRHISDFQRLPRKNRHDRDAHSTIFEYKIFPSKESVLG